MLLMCHFDWRFSTVFVFRYPTRVYENDLTGTPGTVQRSYAAITNINYNTNGDPFSLTNERLAFFFENVITRIVYDLNLNKRRRVRY